MTSCAPMRQDNPIVTLVLKSVTEVKTVGPDIDIKITVKHLGQVFDVTLNTTDKVLAQFHYADLAGSTISLSFAVKEQDPIYADSTTRADTLIIDLARDYALNGSKTVTVDLIGANEGPNTPARDGQWRFLLEWYLAPNVQDTIKYIHGEMIRSLGTADFGAIKKDWSDFQSLKWYEKVLPLGEVDDLVSGGQALHRWRNIVGYGKPWDHKPCIFAETGDTAFYLDRMLKFRFDIWSNVHYGFVGRAIGFPTKLLIDGAGFAQARNDGVPNSEISRKASQGKLYEFDHPEDTAAIKLGTSLWSRYGAGLTKEQLEDEILKTGFKIERSKTSKTEIKEYKNNRGQTTVFL
jgi:hypothetical protein